MPRNMFRDNLQAETSQRAVEPDSTPAKACIEQVDEEAVDRPSSSEVELSGKMPITSGDLVVVEGLMKCPAFNGLSAIVQAWDNEAGRYEVLLASPGGFQQAKIKEENLRLVLPAAR